MLEVSNRGNAELVLSGIFLVFNSISMRIFAYKKFSSY